MDRQSRRAWTLCAPTTRPILVLVSVGALFLAVAVPTDSPRAATFQVTSTADTTAPGTLRWAINQGNAAGAGAHNITFALPAFSTITLTSQFESWGVNFGAPPKTVADHG